MVTDYDKVACDLGVSEFANKEWVLKNTDNFLSFPFLPSPHSPSNVICRYCTDPNRSKTPGGYFGYHDQGICICLKLWTQRPLPSQRRGCTPPTLRTSIHPKSLCFLPIFVKMIASWRKSSSHIATPYA